MISDIVYAGIIFGLGLLFAGQLDQFARRSGQWDRSYAPSWGLGWIVIVAFALVGLGACFS